MAAVAEASELSQSPTLMEAGAGDCEKYAATKFCKAVSLPKSVVTAAAPV
jgi:hypothetical protein